MTEDWLSTANSAKLALAHDFLSEGQSTFTICGTHLLAEKAWIQVDRLGQLRRNRWQN